MLTIGSLTAGEWIVASASGALLLLSLVPVLWACWLFVQMSDGTAAEAIAEAQHKADLKHGRGV